MTTADRLARLNQEARQNARLLRTHYKGSIMDRAAAQLEELADSSDALIRAAEALRAIRRRIPYDAENEDANGWGAVDAALAGLAEEAVEAEHG